jgi:hypothetical protein
MQKVTLSERLTQIGEYWRPKVVGELNGQEVKLVKFKGEFVWHHHEHEDEQRRARDVDRANRRSFVKWL